MQNYINQSQIDKIFNLSLQAGEIAKQAFLTKNFQIYTKNDKSKLSSIDLEISGFINNHLAQISPEIPIICEEGKLRNFQGEIFFLIDPIDGTSSFINNNEQFCINIGLIKNNKPCFGMIYAPLFEGGKMMINNAQNKVISYDHKTKKNKILEKIDCDFKNLKIITSSRTKDEDITNYVAQFYPQHLLNFQVEKLSSALKFFRIIEGKANLYLHPRQTMEWDTASGHALINSLGQKLININYNNKIFSLGNELQYKKNNFINNGFIITTK